MKRLIFFAGLFVLLSAYSGTLTAQETTEKHASHHHSGCPAFDSIDHDDFPFNWDEFDFRDFPFKKNKHKYNGHWAGFELGIGGYVNSGFNMDFNPEYPYLNMNTARSLMVNFNLFETNVNLVDQHFGFTTGLGFQTSNYYFTDNYVMLQDSAVLVAYKVQDEYGNAVSLKTNKMVVSYLNLPLLFEYQTNRYRKSNSFHIAAGVIGGVRIGSYTKQTYRNESGNYYLVDDKGNRVAAYDVNDYKVRNRGPYHLSPFKVDAALRFGWSHLNFFATMSLTRLFQTNQGPEVYPYTVGLTLVGW